MEKDNIQHMAICALISLYSSEAAAAASLTKEWCDYKVYPQNNWSNKDCLFDIIGIVIGTAIRVIIIGRWNWF